ncbi:MAG: DUF2334 domain-containing protein [Candidatus Moraniibacteriota bacterium]|nr:MAG: DUF2334 domain-containing protein [Candidatus Moranbacteria bacterium]
MKRFSLGDPIFLFRIDDLCPTMDWGRLTRLIELFDFSHVRSILGVIPENQDPKLQNFPARADFWEQIRDFSGRGHCIAQHGYRHLYESHSGGLLDIHQKSEFAGLPYEIQLEKIQKGKSIMEEHLRERITWFMPPAHSFDQITCRALTRSGFTHLTDGIALFPFSRYGLTWIPQQLWRPRHFPFGVWTICLHPDTMSESAFQEIQSFLQKHAAFCSSDPRTLASTRSPLNPFFQSAWKLSLSFSRLSKKWNNPKN